MCRNINIRQRLCENLTIKNKKLFIPVANCKIFQEFFWQVCKHCFAFTLTPCTNYVMIVTHDCLSIPMECDDIRVHLSQPKHWFQRSSLWAIFFFLSSNVLTRCASSSLLCWYHSCSICSLCSFQLQLLQNTVRVLHDFIIQQFFFFFHWSQRHCRLWLSFLVNNLPISECGFA